MYQIPQLLILLYYHPSQNVLPAIASASKCINKQEQYPTVNYNGGCFGSARVQGPLIMFTTTDIIYSTLRVLTLPPMSDIPLLTLHTAFPAEVNACSNVINLTSSRRVWPRQTSPILVPTTSSFAPRIGFKRTPPGLRAGMKMIGQQKTP